MTLFTAQAGRTFEMTKQNYDGPKRKGRPPVGEVAMSSAERVRRHRSKMKEQSTVVTDTPELVEVSVLLVELQRQLKVISVVSTGEKNRYLARWHAARLMKELAHLHGLGGFLK